MSDSSAKLIRNPEWQKKRRKILLTTDETGYQTRTRISAGLQSRNPHRNRKRKNNEMKNNKCIFWNKGDKKRKHSEEGGFFRNKFICIFCQQEFYELERLLIEPTEVKK